ncbi:hypothetical protein ABPG73_019508 [Tetrahymena malaccensis]
MDPKFRSQIFITNDDVSFQLQDNLFAFAFKREDTGVYLREIEAKESKTYLTYRGQYIYRNGTDIRFFNVSITNCQDPALIGFNCFDFSALQNYSMAVGNTNNVFSDLLIYVYRCQDTDIQYHPMPSNCADPQEIEEYINLVTGVVQFKLYTQQYNTTSKEFETNYKNFYRLTSGEQMQLFDFKVQKQITTISQGLLLQSNSVHSSPISYEEFEGSFDFQKFAQSTGQNVSEQKDLSHSEENKSPVLVPYIDVKSRQSVFTSFVNQQNEVTYSNNDEIKQSKHLNFAKNEKYQLSDLQQSQPYEQKAIQLVSCDDQNHETGAQEKKDFPIKLELKLLTESLTDNLSPQASNQDRLLKFQSIRKKKNTNKQERLKNSQFQEKLFNKIKQPKNITTNPSNISQKIKTLKNQQIIKKAESILFNYKLKRQKQSNQLDPQIMKYDESASHFEKQFAISLFEEKQIEYAKQFLIKYLNEEEAQSEIDQRIYSSLM